MIPGVLLNRDINVVLTISLFIHAFNRYSLTAYYLSGTVLNREIVAKQIGTPQFS